MKFGKEFTSQMVPEWEGAYMDYASLKSVLEDLKLFKLKNPHQNNKHSHINPTVAAADGGGLNRNFTMYRSFSGLLSRIPSISLTHSPGHHHHHHEEPVILVQSLDHGDPEQGRSIDYHKYETKFLMSNEQGGELEQEFFYRLDDEFNKVNKFYKDKVDQVMSEAALLNKQMDGLIAFRVKVERPDDQEDKFEQLSKEIAESAAVFSISSSPSSPTPIGSPKTTEMVHMDVIEETNESSSRGNYSEENKPSSHNGNSYSEESAPSNRAKHLDDESNIIDCGDEKKPKELKTRRPAPLDILNNVKIFNTLGTPRSTVKGILSKNGKYEELNFGKKNLKRVEEQLKSAFIHFYHKLQLLKSYSFLNLMAFSKIMKRYDKVTSRSASKIYLKMVDNSYIGSSDDVTRLMDRVEATFIKHFSNSNRSSGMNILRSKKRRERHRTTYSSGFFSGCTIALLVSLILVIHVRKLIKNEGSTRYMETMFPLYSLFGFVVLHMLMYSANLFFWQCHRINYPFIFGFKQGTELGFRQVFLVSTILATISLAGVLANLDMEMDITTKKYEALTELIPLALVVLVLLITFCPLDIMYRSSRFFFIRTTFHCICAPFYKVTLPDFVLADQFTSQVQALRSLEFYICYYAWGDYRYRESSCKTNSVFNTSNFIVATIPFWLRFLQCIRRYLEEKDIMQGINGLKFLSIIGAVLMRTAYSKWHGMGWWVMAWISSVIAAVAATYWDLVVDWGLLQRNSKNPWLRDKLLVSQKSVYFGAMVLNVLLRFAWLQTVLNFQLSFLHSEALIAIVASLEIIRRGIWNFFRLENEHLNNVGKFRAFKTVPLPFNYGEVEDKDE
ncbi:hypothetical protein MKW94_016712 [Papaver nudicaule]|uniref:Phosphate transporter PHO1 homolog 3-like n=1 Tax=Papaver nudicaule TaxID=74823 RepID=A0AA41RP47_PAPNU|nr:hypothetical protein [Papaver nudicaule]